MLSLTISLEHGLTDHCHDQLASLNILTARGSTDKLFKQMENVYNLEFGHQVNEIVEQALDDNTNPVLMVQVDNYNKYTGCRYLKVGPNSNNTVSQSAMMRVLLEGNLHGGYGVPYNGKLVSNMAREVKDHMSLNTTSPWILKSVNGDDRESEYWHSEIPKLGVDDNYRNNNHFNDLSQNTIIPQVRDYFHSYLFLIRSDFYFVSLQLEGLSSKRSVFRNVFIQYLRDLFPSFEKIIFGVCFDTEYVSHFVAGLEDPLLRDHLQNFMVFPAALHMVKHLSGAVLDNYHHVAHLFGPVFLQILKTNPQKWTKAYNLALTKCRTTSVEENRTQDLVDEAVDESAMEVDTLEPEAPVESKKMNMFHNIREVSSRGRTLKPKFFFDDDGYHRDHSHDDDDDEVDDNEYDEEEGEEEEEDEEEEEKENREDAIGDLIDTFTEPQDVSRSKTEVDAKGRRKIRPQAIIDQVALYLGIDTHYLHDNTKKKRKRSEIVSDIVSKLELVKKKKEQSDTFKMNLHRLKQMLYYTFTQWDKHVRESVINKLMIKYKVNTEVEALKLACMDSSTFLGAFKLLDIETRLVVEPFIKWHDGDIKPFLRMFLAQLALIAGSRKTMVLPRNVLFIDLFCFLNNF
jgi:hypothetical protein